MVQAQLELFGLREALNRANVFPVADGDTGHNMASTVAGAVEALKAHGTGPIGGLWQALADGALVSARGNSGVILSQLLAGFAEAAQGQTTWEVEDLKRGFQRAAERARKQVVDPVEGTILTVADAMAGGARTDGDLVACLESALGAGEVALARTTELLPALQGTGLVDAGAMGYVGLVRGWLRAARGERLADFLGESEPLGNPSPGESPTRNYYDVEALLYHLRHPAPERWLSEQLAAVGDSIVIAPGVDQLKVHVHAEDAVALMKIFTTVGDIRQMEWLDMRQQVAERQAEALGVVAPPAAAALFGDSVRVVLPAEAADRPGLLWVDPGQPLSEAVAVPSLAAAAEALLEFQEGDPWVENRARLETVIKKMRRHLVERRASLWYWDGRTFDTREALGRALKQAISEPGLMTVYLSQKASGEEAAFWQEALNAELVPIPQSNPWMEIIWRR